MGKKRFVNDWYRGSPLWRFFNFPKQLAWENKWLKVQVKEARAEIDEIKKSKDRVVSRMKMIEDRISDIARIGFASNYTREDIMKMDEKEFKECEKQIEEDCRDGKTFLP